MRAAERERFVAANDSEAIDAEDTRERGPVCSSRIALICFESFSRVDSASWMQSSRLESRMRASNEEVGWIDEVVDRKGLEGGARDSFRGRSVKLVYMPSERWNNMQFGGRGMTEIFQLYPDQFLPCFQIMCLESLHTVLPINCNDRRCTCNSINIEKTSVFPVRAQYLIVSSSLRVTQGP